MHVKNACLLAAVATMTVTSAQATPRSAEGSGQYFLQAAEDLNSWHVGAYFRSHERRVEDDNGFETDVDIDRALAIVGYDVLPWLAIYGALGGCDASEKYSSGSDAALEYGMGAWFNLLDHDTFDFLETVQRFRVQGTLQYTMFDNDDFTWGELAGNVTFGITHEVIGNKFLWPNAITAYVGPAFNVVVSDDYDADGDNMFGLVAGVEAQISERTGIGASAEKYQDDTAFTGHVMVRF